MSARATRISDSVGFPAVSRDNRSRDTFHTLCLNPYRHWRRLLAAYGPADRDFRDRARAIAAVSPAMEVLCAAERLGYGRRIREARLVHPPVFIIGHWRSGTTLLHNALSRDPQFGYVTLFQSLAPGSFLIGRRTLQPLLLLRAPNTRPMDNVKIHMRYPSEEEYALAHLCPQSMYAGFNFPRALPELFERFGLMRGISRAERSEWRAAYRELLIKATINFSGRRLVLKNPVNTGRIREVLQTFPGAKFIHIHRNPYEVFRSTLHLYRAVLKVTSLQRISGERLVEYVLDFYPRLMDAYWEQRAGIPPGDHAEIRYEDLVRSPLSEIKRVYAELGLGGWNEARSPIADYLVLRDQFEANTYVRDSEYDDLVDRHWGYAIERLGYDSAGVTEAANA
jgi:hypothetical protein